MFSISNLALEKYNSSVQPPYVGLRTDFIDVEFEDYKVEVIGI